MSTLAESLGEGKKPWLWIAAGGAVLLVWAALAIPSMMRSSVSMERQTGLAEQLVASAPAASSAAFLKESHASKVQAVSVRAVSDATAGRKIIRTSSMEVIVQRPAEVADEITTLVESLGGYVVSSEGGGQTATSGTLTIRVPAAQFEKARMQIRSLGLRVDSEKVEAQDVTQQYVDQDANIRNLRAEEAQYLAILRQANTVKDMLVVTEKLSEVRGQIEQQQAEFNALSRQVETVALSISLRTEPAPQTFGLNWRPGEQFKIALRDGLESLANYATAMMSILFYLPATLLWVGTIVFGALIGWRAVRWIGRRWYGGKETALQG